MGKRGAACRRRRGLQLREGVAGVAEELVGVLGGQMR